MAMSLVLDWAGVDRDAPPDLTKPRELGVRACVVRSTYSTSDDPTDQRDRAAILAAGMVFGAYMFPVFDRGAPSPADQVAAFVRGTTLTRRDFPPVLDVEFPHGIAATGRTRAEIAAMIREFARLLRDAFGAMPMIYTSGRVWNGSDADCLGAPALPDLAECPVALARYPYKYRIDPQLQELSHAYDPPAPAFSGAWFWHQFQGDAVHFPGFTSTVDVGRIRVTRAGDTGDHVRWIQRRAGVAEGVPGVMCPATVEAVRREQATAGLDIDGVVGAGTFAVLSWLRPAAPLAPATVA